MKELSISRTVVCPRRQEFESETYWGKNKFYKENQPRSVELCTKCDYHGGIKQYRDGKPPKVSCLHDEAPKRAEIKSLEKALEIVEKHGGEGTQIEMALNILRGSEQNIGGDIACKFENES